MVLAKVALGALILMGSLNAAASSDRIRHCARALFPRSQVTTSEGSTEFPIELTAGIPSDAATGIPTDYETDSSLSTDQSALMTETSKLNPRDTSPITDPISPITGSTNPITRSTNLRSDTINQTESALLNDGLSNDWLPNEGPHNVHLNLKLQPPMQRIYGVQSVVDRWRLINYLSDLVFTPFKKLAEVDGAVEVVGPFGFRSNKKLAQKIAVQLHSFDQWMGAFGFEKPLKTRVIIGRRGILKNVIGPVSVPIPIFNIFERKMADHLIALNPIEWFSKSIEDESVLFHERMHSILYSTYNQNAFVIEDRVMQEALADFGAAHFLDSPEIGRGILSANEPMRDIEKKTAIEQGVSTTFERPRDVVNGTIHQRSLFLSHVLWELRKKLGVPVFNQIYKPLLDGLSDYRKSYLDILRFHNLRTPSESKRLHQDRQFILVTALRVSMDEPRELRSAIVRAVRAIALAKNNDLDVEFIFEVSRYLTPDRSDKNPKNDDMMFQTISASAYGVSGFILKWSSALWMGKKIIDVIPLL